MNARSLIKRAAGSLWLAAPTTRSVLCQRATIVMLHRVLSDDAEADIPHRRALCIGAGAFNDLLIWLTRHFDCVPLEDLLKTPGGERPRLALTFDDGWRDNAEIAFPLLQRHGVPASIFLATDFIGTPRRFWWEAIGESLWNRVGDCRELMEALAARGKPVPRPLCSPALTAERSRAIGAFLQQLKTLPPSQLDELVLSCPAQSHPDALSWGQVASLESSGLVRFGSHGAGHAILTQLSDTELQADLARAAATLADHCSAPLPVFCYPNGDLDPRVRNAVVAQGYRYALSTRPGLVGVATDSLSFPRMDVGHRAAVHPGLLGWRLFQGSRK